MDEIQQATTNNLGCSQPGSGEEDCLSLNVFTPQVNLGEKCIYFSKFTYTIIFKKQLPSESNQMNLPVMVWIHGGSFTLWHAYVYQADRFMEHDIVLVVIQYRLGPLGNNE